MCATEAKATDAFDKKEIMFNVVQCWQEADLVTKKFSLDTEMTMSLVTFMKEMSGCERRKARFLWVKK